MLLYNQLTHLFCTFIHAVVIAAFNSSTQVIASMFFCSVFLSRSHTFSMVFKSGDCAGQESDFVSFLSLYSTTERAL